MEHLNELARQSQTDSPELTPRQRRRRRKSQNRGTSSRGRFLLVIMFLALRVADAVMYFGSPPGNERNMLSSILTSAIWTTALLVVIGYRKNWARYALGIILALGILGSIIVLPASFEKEIRDRSLVVIISILSFIYVGILWCLIASPSIKRLTDCTKD